LSQQKKSADIWRSSTPTENGPSRSGKYLHTHTHNCGEFYDVIAEKHTLLPKSKKDEATHR
jgi:hypothetical protein